MEVFFKVKRLSFSKDIKPFEVDFEISFPSTDANWGWDDFMLWDTLLAKAIRTKQSCSFQHNNQNWTMEIMGRRRLIETVHYAAIERLIPHDLH